MYNIRYLSIFLLSIFFICSCSTSSKSWIVSSNNELPSLYLNKVLVDKASGWTSIEREIQGMLPILFSEYNYPFIHNHSDAAYIVDVQAVEREYMSGWKSNRSVSIEIRIYQNNGIDQYLNTVPVIVGKTVVSGNASLASSKNLDNLLRSAIKKIAASFKTLKKENR